MFKQIFFNESFAIQLLSNNLIYFQPTKKTKFLHSHEVSFFSGCKAVDSLLNDSPWAKAKVVDPDTAELVFESREHCVEFLDELLKQKMFHRAKKIPVTTLKCLKDKLMEVFIIATWHCIAKKSM